MMADAEIHRTGLEGLTVDLQGPGQGFFVPLGLVHPGHFDVGDVEPGVKGEDLSVGLFGGGGEVDFAIEPGEGDPGLEGVGLAVEKTLDQLDPSHGISPPGENSDQLQGGLLVVRILPENLPEVIGRRRELIPPGEELPQQETGLQGAGIIDEGVFENAQRLFFLLKLQQPPGEGDLQQGRIGVELHRLPQGRDGPLDVAVLNQQHGLPVAKEGLGVGVEDPRAVADLRGTILRGDPVDRRGRDAGEEQWEEQQDCPEAQRHLKPFEPAFAKGRDHEKSALKLTQTRGRVKFFSLSRGAFTAEEAMVKFTVNS